MPAEPRYIVREAVLVKTDHGSAWSVHFVPEEGSAEEQDEIAVSISPTDIDEMLFATTYTLAEIRAPRTVVTAEEPRSQARNALVARPH